MSRTSERTLVESFRDSTHLIPSRVINKKKPSPYDPLIMKTIVCMATALQMMGIGIALEVGLGVSARNNGFSVPQKNIVSFVSPQFLISFFPTLFVIPLAFLWREIDWMVRWYEPYVVLSRGRATAEESLLLDYIALGTFFTLFRALKYKHRIVFWSALTAAITYLFQPLAGAIFQLRQMEIPSDTTVVSLRETGLAPEINQLNDFLAAAGYAEAAVAHNLTDPPFVKDGWATAEFQLPSYPGFNGSIAVNTTGVQTNTACVTPLSFSLTRADSIFNYAATSPDGCSANANFNGSNANEQYGVVPVQCPGGPSNVTFQPVLFWFFHSKHDENNTAEAKGVFCSPTIQTSKVIATANLADNTMSSCVRTGDVAPLPLTGAYNALIFSFSANVVDEVSNPDPFISARATAIKSGVPGAIFRLARQSASGLQAVFDLPNGFRDLTDTVYKQHLALAAKSVYFVPVNKDLPATLTSSVTRLLIDPLPGHVLAFLLFIVGFIGVVIHILGRRARRRLNLCAPPGSIAAVMALTSRSGFGELLLPYDDEKTLEKKLDGLRFKIDGRTGAIVADEKGYYEFGGGSQGRDDAMLSLLGGPGSTKASSASGTVVDDLDTYNYSDSSSQLAHQAAAGYPPWVTRGTA